MTFFSYHFIAMHYTSVPPCTLVCYTYWLTCRQKQGNAMYGVRTVIVYQYLSY